VTITGTNFSNVTNVTIDGAELGSRTVVNPAQISGTTPAANSPGAKDVVVTSSSHGGGTCSGCFTYNPQVTVTAVTPASGPLAGATSVTITGTNFANVTSVTIGGSELGSRTVVSATEITGTTPASSSAGAQDVVVTSSSHGGGTCVGCFTYVSRMGLQTQRLAAGANHACALDDAGAAYCWGSGNQLGNGSRGLENSTPVPVPVSGVLRFSSLAAGGEHTCGLTLDGRAFCWGSNSSGQIGNGSLSVIVVVPDYVVGGRTFSAITAGRYHSCALTGDGVAYCWGDWIYESTSATPVAVPGELRFSSIVAGGAHSCGLTSSGAAYCWGGSSPTPTAVPGGLTFSTLVAGGIHTCGLTGSGAAYCWGANGRGQLGDGSLTDSPTPVAVAGGHTFTTLGSGPAAYHTCGVTASGAAYCWGGNHHGELGDGSYENRSTPVAVSGGLTFITVATGEAHTCGRSSAGAYYCWGDDYYGQLGDGDNQALDPLPVSGMPRAVAVAAGGHSCAVTSGGSAYCWGGGSATPVAVSGGLHFTAISVGSYHTCGLASTGPAHCWGLNRFGQLGDGSNMDAPTPVEVTGGLTFNAVTAGFTHTCGITSAGAAYCWGQNMFGELGNGSQTNASAPVAVSGGLTFSALAAGAYFTCGITSTGAAYCWGWNWGGQLGNGSSGFFEQSLSPVPVLGGLEFSAVTTGQYHTCGITTNGAAHCWGNNTEGQLGDGSFYEGLTPVPVSGGLRFTAVGAGDWHSCGLTDAGAAYCWGWLGAGWIGDRFPSPTAVAGGLTFSALNTGSEHNCALDQAGTVYCWGANWFGELGRGTFGASPVPVEVAPFAASAAVATPRAAFRRPEAPRPDRCVPLRLRHPRHAPAGERRFRCAQGP
jgi:alpha-tubulin suppressor-like RCC1 family protein